MQRALCVKNVSCRGVPRGVGPGGRSEHMYSPPNTPQIKVFCDLRGGNYWEYLHHHKGKISQVPMEKIASIPWHTCDFKIPAPPYLRFHTCDISCVLAIFGILAIFRVKPYLRFFSQVCFTKSQVWRAKGTACAQYRKYSKAKIASMSTLWQHQIASMLRGNRKYANSESQVCQDQIASIPKANRKYSK